MTWDIFIRLMSYCKYLPKVRIIALMFPRYNGKSIGYWNGCLRVFFSTSAIKNAYPTRNPGSGVDLP